MKALDGYAGINFTEKETPLQLAFYDDQRRQLPGPAVTVEMNRRTFDELFRRMEYTKEMMQNVSATATEKEKV